MYRVVFLNSRVASTLGSNSMWHAAGKSAVTTSSELPPNNDAGCYQLRTKASRLFHVSAFGHSLSSCKQFALSENERGMQSLAVLA